MKNEDEDNLYDPATEPDLPWIRRRELVKKIAQELQRQKEPPLTPIIRRQLKQQYGIVATHLASWTDLYGRKWCIPASGKIDEW